MKGGLFPLMLRPRRSAVMSNARHQPAMDRHRVACCVQPWVTVALCIDGGRQGDLGFPSQHDNENVQDA